MFDEARYFTPGDESDPLELYVIGGVKVGISICEDIWSPFGALSVQAAAGAELNININGSPFSIGKGARRERMLADAGRRLALRDRLRQPGRRAGRVGLRRGVAGVRSRRHAARPRRPVRRATAGRRRADPAGVPQAAARSARTGDARAAADGARVGHHRSCRATAHVAPVAEPFDDDRELYDALVLGTRDYCRKNGFSDVVIGLSGGIDSTIVACIAADALGAEHVHGVSMPSRYSSDHSKSDAELLAANLGIDYRTIPIEPSFQAYLDMLAPSFEGREPGLTYENIQSRCRGQTLMALSNEFGWMVLTTGNKSEMAVGYFTIYGDSVGGYGVIKDVLKTRVYDLCRYVNSTAGREIVPEERHHEAAVGRTAARPARRPEPAAVRRARSDPRAVHRARSHRR